MKGRKVAALLLALALLLAACARKEAGLQDAAAVEGEETAVNVQPVPETIDSLEQLMEMVNERHMIVDKPQVVLEEEIYRFSQASFDMGPYGEPRVEYNHGTPLTYEQAKGDLELAQTWLRELYLPYYYFGGDEVFDPLFEDRRVWMEERAETGELVAEDVFGFLYLLAQDYIKDFHFKVNHYMVSMPALPYVYGEELYVKTDQGFQASSGLLVDTCGEDRELDELFQLFIHDDGTLVWRPAVLTLDEELGDLIVTYTDGTEESLPPKRLEWTVIEIDEMAELQSRGGVPLLVTSGMGFDKAPGEMGREFLDALDILGQEPVLMVDLRGNGGGNMVMPLQWLEKYTGMHVPTNSLGITSLGELEMDPESWSYIPAGDVQAYMMRSQLNDKFASYYDEPDYFVMDNDRLLVVLTSKNSASAAETFVDAAHNVANVLFVGTHTAGMMTSNAYTTLYLPESGVALSMGSDIYLYEDSYFQEYMGFAPDLWVDGDAADLVVKMLERFQAA